jgi:hypothetical protein
MYKTQRKPTLILETILALKFNNIRQKMRFLRIGPADMSLLTALSHSQSLLGREDDRSWPHDS